MQLVFPAQCILCRSLYVINEFLCQCCIESLVPVAPLRITLTGVRSLRVCSALAYQDLTLRLIHRKYHGDYLASYELARLMVMRYRHVILRYDFLVPVPMYWSRELWRGFNHTESISAEMTSLTGVVTLLALHRTHNTRLQRGLSASEREKNVKGSVVLREGYGPCITGKKVLLIDDVYTTGSTVKQAARALLPGKPHKIDVLVGARALLS